MRRLRWRGSARQAPRDGDTTRDLTIDYDMCQCATAPPAAAAAGRRRGPKTLRGCAAPGAAPRAPRPPERATEAVCAALARQHARARQRPGCARPASNPRVATAGLVLRILRFSDGSGTPGDGAPAPGSTGEPAQSTLCERRARCAGAPA